MGGGNYLFNDLHFAVVGLELRLFCGWKGEGKSTLSGSMPAQRGGGSWQARLSRPEDYVSHPVLPESQKRTTEALAQ